MPHFTVKRHTKEFETMTKPTLFILSFLFILITVPFSASVCATATTHIWGPSADVQGFNLWHLTTDVYIAVEDDEGGNQIAPVTNLGLTVGILPLEKVNMELGFDHKSGLGSADDYPWYGNVKIGIPETAFGAFFPALAFGAYDIGTKSDMTNYNVIYAKAAKALKFGAVDLGRLSVGYFTGNEDLMLDSSGDSDESGIMAAWERTMSELSDKLWLCVEYMGTDSAYGSLNVGAAWKVASNVGVLAGYTIYNNENLANTATIQIDIDF